MIRLAAAAGLACLAAAPAQAFSIWTIERLSDQSARITMDGTIDELLNLSDSLSLVGAALSTGDGGVEPVGGDFVIGAAAADQTFVDAFFDVFEIGFDTFFLPGSSATGALRASLDDVETWEPIGTTGDVTNGANGDGNVIGTFTIVAPSATADIPLPAPAVALLLGLASLAGLGLKRRA